MSLIFQNIDPPLPSPHRECVRPPPPASPTKAGVRYTIAGRRGGSIFWKTRDIVLPSQYSKNKMSLRQQVFFCKIDVLRQLQHLSKKTLNFREITDIHNIHVLCCRQVFENKTELSVQKNSVITALSEHAITAREEKTSSQLSQTINPTRESIKVNKQYSVCQLVPNQDFLPHTLPPNLLQKQPNSQIRALIEYMQDDRSCFFRIYAQDE